MVLLYLLFIFKSNLVRVTQLSYVVETTSIIGRHSGAIMRSETEQGQQTGTTLVSLGWNV